MITKAFPAGSYLLIASLLTLNIVNLILNLKNLIVNLILVFLLLTLSRSMLTGFLSWMEQSKITLPENVR